ncbi:MAG: hypothetical protein HF981_19470 [Desulfobacteraceae bacterium]|nr:hypothetical protein [Desulfobacteraceae bacterium]MBC2752581.1 hypothetical protein [Desulfobacteraceae bacterium]
MTIRIPDPDIGDKILRYFGKKRALIFPNGKLEAQGIDVYATAVKENFWAALLRPRNSQLPAGAVDYETVRKKFDDIRNVRS